MKSKLGSQTELEGKSSQNLFCKFSKAAKPTSFIYGFVATGKIREFSRVLNLLTEEI